MLLLPALVGMEAAGSADRNLAGWRWGPVRYLLTGSEDKEFKHLETDAERRRFIDGFWARRDPTPGTPENEFREIFIRRIRETNALFNATTRQGWSTNRGRIYILLGPPDDREANLLQKEGRGQIRWIYRGAPSDRSAPNRIIAFQEDPSGEFRLDTNPASNELTFSFTTESSLQLAASPTDQMRPLPGPTSGGIELDLGDLLRPPGEEDLLQEIIRSEGHPGRFPFVSRADFYRSDEGLTFVALNLGVDPRLLEPGTGPDSLLPLARLESLDDPDRAIDFVYRNPFVGAPDNTEGMSHWVFQAGQGVPPGRYRAYLGIFDPTTGDTVSRQESLVVPTFPASGLGISSLTLARRAEALESADETGPYKRPFVLAGRRVVPRLLPTFHNGETFSLYYQIYGARREENGGTDLLVEYRFFVHEAEGSRTLGEPIRSTPTEQAVGWQFPLIGWPVAGFRLQVTVTDRIAHESASAEIDFRVEG